jgi:pimeloyl-ACP methyl ester carboxylesterase
MRIVYLLIISVLIVSASCKNSEPVSERKTLEIKTESATIFYQEQGRGDTTLLFIHGWCINSGYWDDQLSHFSNKYRVIAIDLPGFGKSKADRKEWSVENYATDVVDFIELLKLKNVILIGHSMSGDVILEASLRHPKAVKGIIGIDNFKIVNKKYTPEQHQELDAFLNDFKSNYKIRVSEYATQLFPSHTDTLIINRLKNDFANADSVVSLSALDHVMLYRKIEAERLSRLKLRLNLLINDSMPADTSALQKFCRNSYEIFTIKNTGHYPMIEAPDEFNRILAEVIQKI